LNSRTTPRWTDFNMRSVRSISSDINAVIKGPSVNPPLGRICALQRYRGCLFLRHGRGDSSD
jgi:hypothetical protein